MAKGVWIVAEQRDGVFRKISFELASTARKLADVLGEEVCAVLCGSGIEGIAGQLGKYGVDKVFVADSPAFEPYTTDAHAAAVAKIVKENDPAVLLLGASTQGKDLSARLVGKLATGMATDCTDVKIADGKLLADPADVCRKVLRRGGVFHLSADGVSPAECLSHCGKREGGRCREVRSRP